MPDCGAQSLASPTGHAVEFLQNRRPAWARFVRMDCRMY